MKEDVKRAIDTGVNGVVMEIPSSKHMVDLTYRWPMEKAIETSIEATKFAHDNGLEVVFFPIDFSRAELKWAIDLIEKVGKEGPASPRPPGLRITGTGVMPGAPPWPRSDATVTGAFCPKAGARNTFPLNHCRERSEIRPCLTPRTIFRFR